MDADERAALNERASLSSAASDENASAALKERANLSSAARDVGASLSASALVARASPSSSQSSGGRAFVAAVLRFLLLVALIGAGWSIYRRQPGGSSPFQNAGQYAETNLKIVVRRAPSGQPVRGRVQLYSIDVNAARREFFSERREGTRLEDFMMRRMGGRAPLEAEFDERGQATIKVPPGKWWVHATIDASTELTWRLPVNIAGRDQSVELTPDNAYARTKTF
ncbi:MAG TPA: hypothetical protein VGB73_19725 [Pyrinomonadaceae bacterium]|jgi:hypothetical protein